MYTRFKKDPGPKKPLAVSYWSKTKIKCPVCQKDFQREEMLTGSGRLNAGALTEELHREYIPTARYGKINPLIYAIGACPNCHSAFFWNDFNIKWTVIQFLIFGEHAIIWYKPFPYSIDDACMTYN